MEILKNAIMTDFGGQTVTMEIPPGKIQDITSHLGENSIFPVKISNSKTVDCELKSAVPYETELGTSWTITLAKLI